MRTASTFLGMTQALTILSALALSSHARADTMTWGGTVDVAQFLEGTAVQNPSLNGVRDGDPYTATLTFNGSISGPGNYDLTGATLLFSDPTAGATESSFVSENLSVTQDGSSYDLLLFACLSYGVCEYSGALTDILYSYFSIPASAINSTNVTAAPLPLFTPFVLGEDGGETEVFGSVTNYSYSNGPLSSVPEPSETIPLIVGLAALSFRASRQRLTGLFPE
jgi:hypothetical protein